eukprot:Sro2137_g316070.1 n/a (300) ;mRNA; f:17065-17966
MAINVAVEIGKRLFIWGVLAMVALPRQHIDRAAWSIGGGLSHSFRKLLAASVALNLCRLLAKLYGHARLLADLLGILQAVSLSFLCFLTPYVLQTWMVSQINIGGRPGSNLLPALYGNGVLSVLGVVLCRLVHPNLWCIKRLGNIISAPPVLSTMAMYNSVTSVGGHHRGRGTIMAQTIVVAEYWYIITQSLCFLGLALDKHSGEDDYSSWDYCLKAFRNIAFVSDWTRVCVHGIFINHWTSSILWLLRILQTRQLPGTLSFLRRSEYGFYKGAQKALAPNLIMDKTKAMAFYHRWRHCL